MSETLADTMKRFEQRRVVYLGNSPVVTDLLFCINKTRSQLTSTKSADAFDTQRLSRLDALYHELLHSTRVSITYVQTV